jgi:archaellum biogenesis ATPase FlaH
MNNTIQEKLMFNALELVKLGIKVLPTLIDPIIPKTNLIALIGSSDIGKSSLLLQMCIDVALHKTFLDFPINATHNRTIYVSTEDDPNVLSLRLQKLQGVEADKLERMRFIFQTDNLVSRLDKELTLEKADLVVIDTFTDIFTREMNQVNQVRSFMNEYNNLSIKHGCVIIFNHHTGKKAEESEPSKTNAIGSAGFEGRARLVMELRRDYNDEGMRHLCIVKGNNIGAEYKSKSFELAFDWSTGFVRTGNRKEFAQLVKPQPGRPLHSMVARSYERGIVDRLHKKGRSIRRIEAIMARMGMPVRKSTIGEWIKCPSTRAA